MLQRISGAGWSCKVNVAGSADCICRRRCGSLQIYNGIADWLEVIVNRLNVFLVD
jgi:hypothetical protein